MTSVFVVAKLMQKVIKAYTCKCLYVRLCLHLHDCTINADIGIQDHIRLNIPISDAY